MTARRNPPLLRRSELTGRVYVITRYTRRPPNLVVASEKWDVTEEFDAICDGLTARVAELEACLADVVSQLEIGSVK